MNITKHHVVTFHYTLSNDQGEQLESSRDAEPSLYLHGANNIIKGLEEALEGHRVGDTLQVSLSPQQAYGLRNAERVQKVPVKHLLFQGKLRPGLVVQMNTEQGRHPVTVVKVGRHSATVDTNHPLAGQTLHFDIEVVDIRQANSEEIAHGHAHGPGGHQH
ncbi:peptidylprolyl isomerase [Parahaliea sp. F7430]|uniref:Peptidyl-prolyl cis-trans isomerase n=1 Tax=Sediminihaliea albiluteola TaxID=2758564 RepID=A0A7W2YKP0_9GAMM|nr:peptidylprolyl isomerase [Sediminihaliea albiluteola]MBA6413914.1 peptidylprolyl isomerase [Sediminihaliea albiluteola]